MAALCSDRQQQLRFVVISTDGGRHFGARQPLPGSPSVNFLAISDAHRVFAGNGVEEGDTGSGQFTYQLLASSDGGRHWRVALSETRPLSDVPHGYLGFQSPTVGRWIGDPTTVWTTTDGGARWSPHGAPPAPDG